MELAICLSKYAGEEEADQYFEEFLAGYMQTAVLTSDEIDALPDLIILRILSNVVYFVGRAVSGEGDMATLTTRVETYWKRCVWIKKTLISQMVRDAMRNAY